MIIPYADPPSHKATADRKLKACGLKIYEEIENE